MRTQSILLVLLMGCAPAPEASSSEELAQREADPTKQAGYALAAWRFSDRAVALRAARREVEGDEESRELFHRLHHAGAQVAAAAARGEAPSRDDLDHLEEVRRLACTHPALQELLRRQADYVELVVALDGVIFREAPRMGRRLGS